MRSSVLLTLMVLLIPVLLMAQFSDPIETFDAELDSNYFRYEISDNAADTLSFVDVSLATDQVAKGDGAMRLEYGAHNIEGWGGYSKIEHFAPDSQVFDWSAWDSISFWYYNEVPQSIEGRVNLRFELFDVSDVPDTVSTGGQCEYYYSFHYILDDPQGWNEIVMPLKDGRGDPTLDEWGGEAFNRTGWAGVTGNDKLDKDQIKGWAIEFSISGSGEGDEAHGTIIIDHMSLKGFAGKSLIVFNGMNINPDFEYFGWGQSVIDVVEGEGFQEGSNAMRWTQGDEWGNGWSGAGWNIPATDLSREWLRDSLKFKMKAEVGTPTIRIQIEGGTGKVGHPVDVVADDGEWHDYALALKDFDYVDDTADLDTSAITVLQMMGEGNASAGRVILFDEFWTGNPVIDVLPPDPPTSVDGIPNSTDKYNLVIWNDVEGEEGETYTVYASEEPITDLEAEGVEMVASGVEEDAQSAIHYLYYPLYEKELTYYYAVTCTDDAGNVGEAGLSTSGTVNTAAAAPTISLDLPADLAIDGDISEWLDSDLMPYELAPSLGSHVAVGTIDDDADLSVTMYLAVDDNYLYGAFDVIDNVYSFDPGGDAWQDDMIEMFIGLYNLKSQHIGFERGSEPDYQMYMLADKFTIQNPESGGSLDNPVMINDDANYEYINFGASDWAVEFKLSLDTLAQRTGDDRFYPVNGMKVPIDVVFQDSDNTNIRDGGLSLSPNNNDNSWQSPMNWTHTWIGDTNKVATALEDETNTIVREFELKQNYPNPFNPATTIEYSLPSASDVKLTVYNLVGQKIATLVSEKQTAGLHQVQFDASRFASGVYFYRLEAAGQHQIHKMLLVK